MVSTTPAVGAYPLLPMRSLVVLPGPILPIELGRAASTAAVRHAHEARGPGARRLVIATQRDGMVERPDFDDLHPVAVLAELVQALYGAPGRTSAHVRGLERVHLVELRRAALGGHDEVVVRRAHETIGDPTLTHALAGALQDMVAKHDELLPKAAKTKGRARGLALIRAERSPSVIADLVALHVELDMAARVALLLELHVGERLRRLLELTSERNQLLQVRRDLDEHVRQHLTRYEREALLRHKLRAIQSELTEIVEDDDEVERLRLRLDAAELPRDARELADKGLARLERMNPQSNEANVTRTHLEWLAELPWSPPAAPTTIDLPRARTILARDHHGLDAVKRRVVEYLGVRKLAPHKRGPILCLVGPPGVGKTSIARSIAEALDRPFVRISLGGLRDDAELRGHRRTYVGALPGRILQAMKTARALNPVLLLDELDKLAAPSVRGDPVGAMLEVLDPEQNDGFEDHYLGTPYDLSHAVFIATANELGAIPSVLRDRLEVIEVAGYTLGEKLAIARGHLVPRALRDCGLHGRPLALPDATLELLAAGYTRESGVRQLQRQIDALLRDVAMRLADGAELPPAIEPADVAAILGPRKHLPDAGERVPTIGLVQGLGWTPVGGRLLPVEALCTAGDGKIRLTGQLGDVMRESGQTAISLVRSRAERLGVAQARLASSDIHVHLPHGGVPKDGPSAGIALTTAVVSALAGRPVRHDLAMTGEVTLMGYVLPVGGVREKLIAAHRAGITTIVLPEGNRKDVPDLPPEVREGLALHFVRRVDEVLALALLDTPAPAPAAPAA